METKKLKSEQYEVLVQDLLNNEVVGFPTETVYGLAIVYDSIDAFSRLAKVKKRDINKPVSMMVSKNFDIKSIARVDERAKKIIDAFMPGPITIILPVACILPQHVTMNRNTIGIRIPTNDIALKILESVKKPLLVTSANIASNPPLMKSVEVQEAFYNEIASFIDEDALNGVASTVVDMSHENINILRKGPITMADILKVLEE